MSVGVVIYEEHSKQRGYKYKDLRAGSDQHHF